MPPIGEVNSASRPLDPLARVSSPGASSNSRVDKAPSLNAEDPSLLPFYEKISRFDVQSDRDPPQPVSPWKAPQSNQRYQPVHPIRMLPISGSARLAESEDGTGGGFGVFGAPSPSPRLAGLSLPRGLQRHWSGALSGALQGPFAPSYQANSPGSSKAFSARSGLRDAATWTGDDEAATQGSPTRPGCMPTASGPQTSPSAGAEGGTLPPCEPSESCGPVSQNACMGDAEPAHLPALTASPPTEAGAAKLAGIGSSSTIGGVAEQSKPQVAVHCAGSRQRHHSPSGEQCGASSSSAPGASSASSQSGQPGQVLPRELHQQLLGLRAEVQRRAQAQYDANRRHTMSLRQSLDLLCNAASTAGPRAPRLAPSSPDTAAPAPPSLTSAGQLSALAAERDALAASCSRLQRQCSSLIAYVGLLGGDPWVSAREACTWVRVGLGPGLGLSRAPGADHQPPDRGAGAREGDEGGSEHGGRSGAVQGVGEGAMGWRWAGEEVSGLQGGPVPCGRDGETCCRSLGADAGVASGVGGRKRSAGGGEAATRLLVRLRVASSAAAEGHGGLRERESAVRVELSYVREEQRGDGGADNTAGKSSSRTSADGATAAAFPLAIPLALGVKHHGLPLPPNTQPPTWRQQQQQQQQQPALGQGRSAALEAAVRRLVAVLELEAGELAPPAGAAAARDQPTMRPEASGGASSATGDASSELLDKRVISILQQVLRDRRLAASTSGGHSAAAHAQQQQDQHAPAGSLRPPAAGQLAACFTTQTSPQPHPAEGSLPAGEDEAVLPRPLHAKRARLEQEGTAAPCTTPRIPAPPCSPRTQSPGRHLSYANPFSSVHVTEDGYGGSQGSCAPHHTARYTGVAGEHRGQGVVGGQQQLLEATTSCPVDLHGFDPMFRAWQTEGGVRRGGGGWSDDSDGWPEEEEDGDGEEEELRELAAAAGGSPAALRAAVSFLREQLQLAQYEIVSLTTQLGSLSAQREGLRQRATQSDAALQQLAINEGEAMLELQQARAQLAAERAARARLSTQCDELQRRLLNSLRDSLMLLPHHTTSSIVPLGSSSPGPALAPLPHPHAHSQASTSVPTTARGQPSPNHPSHPNSNIHRLVHKQQGQNHQASRLLRYSSVGHQRPGSHGHGGSGAQGQGGREGAAGSPPASGVWGRAEPLVALWAKARAGRVGAAGAGNAEEGTRAGRGLAD